MLVCNNFSAIDTRLTFSVPTNNSLDTTITDPSVPTKYNLLANVCHEGTYAEGSYRVHIRHKIGEQEQWFEIQDLSVKEILPQLVSLSEAYIQIYELQKKA